MARQLADEALREMVITNDPHAQTVRDQMAGW
jgi:hypothetical protein